MIAAVGEPGLIAATEPPERRGIARDEVRMLVTDRRARTHVHARFFQLPEFLRAGDLLVVNDSATVPGALTATRSGGERIALHVATKIDQRLWLAEPRGVVVPGEELGLPAGGSAVAIAPVHPEMPRLWYVWFHLPAPMERYLAEHGAPISYGYVTQRFALREYQTMFATKPGSSEMPSAARPFTPRVVEKLRQRDVTIATITLHCGVSSFEAPERPSMERYEVSHETAERVDATRSRGHRTIAIGTTAVRALESSVRDDRVIASAGWTDLVLDRDHRLRAVDGLLTGFHGAGATHQWALQSAADVPLLKEAYEEAAIINYRYHEFGDIHLIL